MFHPIVRAHHLISTTVSYTKHVYVWSEGEEILPTHFIMILIGVCEDVTSVCTVMYIWLEVGKCFISYYVLFPCSLLQVLWE